MSSELSPSCVAASLFSLTSLLTWPILLPCPQPLLGEASGQVMVSLKSSSQIQVSQICTVIGWSHTGCPCNSGPLHCEAWGKRPRLGFRVVQLWPEWPNWEKAADITTAIPLTQPSHLQPRKSSLCRLSVSCFNVLIVKWPIESEKKRTERHERPLCFPEMIRTLLGQPRTWNISKEQQHR